MRKSFFFVHHPRIISRCLSSSVLLQNKQSVAPGNIGSKLGQVPNSIDTINQWHTWLCLLCEVTATKMEKLPSLYTLLPQIPLMSINISYCIIFLFFIFKVFSLSFEETVLTSIKIYSSVFFSKISVAQITYFIYISLVRKLLHML